jgi:hypothetical protein
MKNDPQLWAELLKQVPLNCVLMGGAPRDFFYSVEAKDYDIFHPYAVGMPDVPGNWEFVEMNYNDPVQLAAHQADYLEQPGVGNNGQLPIGSVYNYKVKNMWDVVDVQLIGVHYPDPVMHLANFDHTLCLAAYSLDKGLYYAPPFMDSMIARTVKAINLRHNTLERAQAAVKKISNGNEWLWDYQGFHLEEAVA